MTTDRPVAVLTGGGSGIGAATAVRLAEQGMRLVLVGRNLAALTKLAETLPYEPEIVEVDLERLEQLAVCAEAIAVRFSAVAAVVNCAGVTMNRRIERTTLEEMNQLFAVNAMAPFVLCQKLSQPLQQARGCVVNVVSVSASQGVAAQSVYSASKGALVALTRSMATEWGSRGVRVNAVAPGVIRTPMSAPYAVAPYEDYIGMNVPLGRWGEPDDLATTIAFLCSDAARYITGQIITVDGGISSLHWMSTLRHEKQSDSGALADRSATRPA